MAYMDFGEYCVLSSSPERFFNCQNGLVQARPIKGTIRRSDDNDEDEKLKNELLNSDKDISELLMIVDLMRNDLGMSCDAETIKAISNYSLETYENVHHLVATIVGKLSEDEDVFSLIKNIFPGGSITAIIVPGNSKIFGIFNSGNDITIEWNKIKCIGEDVILVEI